MIGLAKSAILIAIIMFISKLLGLIKEILLAKQFGTSYIVDAYTIACSLPAVLFTMFGSGFSNTYVPVYLRIKEENIRKNFPFGVLVFLTSGAIILSIICFLTSDSIVSILAPGFSGKTKVITVLFVKIIVFYLPFFTVFNVISAHLAAYENFVVANFCNSIVVNILIICSILYASMDTPFRLVYGYVISIIIPTIFLFYFAYKKRYILKGKDLYIAKSSILTLCKISIPVGASLFVNQVNSVIDRMFSSSLGVGITSALSYANKIQLIPYSLIVSVFLTVLKPRINKAFAYGEYEYGMYYIRKAVMITTFFSIPTVMVTMLFSEKIIQLLFERGMFTYNSTVITSECLRWYTLSIPFYATREIFNIMLLSDFKQNIMFFNTVFTVVLNVFLNFVFVENFGYTGLPMATALSGFFSCIAVHWYFFKNNIIVFDNEIAYETVKIFGIGVLVFGTCKYLFHQHMKYYINDNEFIAFLCLMCILYFCLTYVFKVNILRWVLSYVFRRRIY